MHSVLHELWLVEEEKVSRLTIPHDTLVFVGDGQKALFLRNSGNEKFPNLIAERVFTDDNPPTPRAGKRSPRSGI